MSRAGPGGDAAGSGCVRPAHRAVPTASPTSYSYRAGRNNVIQWDVPLSCGTSTVYIQNQATANLYIYTPYQPNKAALDAGYGTGNSCSAYGNRNFFNWFTDWFGSTYVLNRDPDAPARPGHAVPQSKTTPTMLRSPLAKRRSTSSIRSFATGRG